MEDKLDLNAIILMIGETNARLRDIDEKLSKLSRKISTANTAVKKETRANILTDLPTKLVFTVKRTVADKYK